MSTITFSVVVPTYNRYKLLRRCIDSILQQKYGNFEILIVDDGSSDRTRETVGTYTDKRIKYYYLQHGERSRARNFGIEKSQGRYLCFIDDDDYVDKEYLSDFYQYLSENDYPLMLLRTGFRQQMGSEFVSTENYDIQSHSNPVRYMAHFMCGVGSLCIPKECLFNDRFPEQFDHFQDTHLFIRLAAQYPFVQLPTWRYYYCTHRESYAVFPSDQFRSRAVNNVEAILDLFRNNQEILGDYLPPGTGDRLAAEKAMQHAAIALIRGRIKDAFHLIKVGNQYSNSARNLYKLLRHLPGLVSKRIKASSTKLIIFLRKKTTKIKEEWR